MHEANKIQPVKLPEEFKSSRQPNHSMPMSILKNTDNSPVSSVQYNYLNNELQDYPQPPPSAPLSTKNNNMPMQIDRVES